MRFILLQIVIVVLLLEIIARAIDPLGVSYYPETARYFDTLVLEEPIGYRNRPGLEDVFYGVPVKINAYGMRDREVGEKISGEFRLLVLGDSVPFGIGVRYEDSFPHQIEMLLNERYPNAGRFSALNLGVPSYNTEQELIQFKSLGLTLAPDAVMLLFSANDIEPKRWVLEKRSRWFVDLTQRSYAGSLLFVLWRGVRSALVATPLAPAHASNALPENTGVALAEYRLDSPRWQAIERSLASIHTQLKTRGIPFVLFTNEELPHIIEMLETVARREGFPIVNLRLQGDPRWAGQDASLFRNSVVDGHPSPLGNRVLATLMVESLERLKVTGNR
ncbi:MAG: hypothetical protein A2150_04835 [Candidatus Muproteobacteria bacterium RBG_16_64_11]|uniref:SGNH hydrolase-type esterase domain-containing protein n=1 Tax=Candidatus Muproteobacteria bacterium RBG_16_64_11 TaxID=1817758 RepID=A0A1F6TGV5_9PROT|nr:MAG: hypothetical protein A2150_04835 [Candidatus Muproteobacteria bacterium RBG_16_64_11]